MQVFISWSGPLSKQLAEVIRQWLPCVIQAVRPYFSLDDIAKGSRWSTEVATELDDSNVGLICVTRDNYQAPWILFEAGALSKKLEESKVCPLLFGIEPTDIQGPLEQFQCTIFDREDVYRVVNTVNSELGENALASDVLDNVFKMWWPQLESEVSQILKEEPADESQPVRTERQLLEEVLSLSRSQRRTAHVRSIHPEVLSDLVEGYHSVASKAYDQGVLETFSGGMESMQRALSYLIRRSTDRDKARDLLQLLSDANEMRISHSQSDEDS